MQALIKPTAQYVESGKTQYGRVVKRSPTHTIKNFSEIREKFLLFRKRFAIIRLEVKILLWNYTRKEFIYGNGKTKRKRL